MPRPNFPTENLEHGLKWTDPLGVQWVWRITGVNEAEDDYIGAWHQVAQETSKLFRKTTFIQNAAEGQVIYLADGVDESVLIMSSAQRELIDFVTPPNPFDGQIITIRFASYFPRVRFYLGSYPGPYNEFAGYLNETICRQYFAGAQEWVSI